MVGEALSSEMVTSPREQGVPLFVLPYGHKIHFSLAFNFWSKTTGHFLGFLLPRSDISHNINTFKIAVFFPFTHTFDDQ